MAGVMFGTLLSFFGMGIAIISPGPTALIMTLLGAAVAIWGTQRRA